jgi:PAS domain-containing protein
MTGGTPLAVLLAVSAFLAALVVAGWLRLRARYRQELSDRDASYKALLEINVRHCRDIAARDARSRNLLEQAREGVVAESDGRVVFATPRRWEMFGWSRRRTGPAAVFSISRRPKTARGWPGSSPRPRGPRSPRDT